MEYGVEVLDKVFVLTFNAKNKLVKIRVGSMEDILKNLPKNVIDVRDRLVKYFLGSSDSFCAEYELEVTTFQKKVFNELIKVKSGSVISYKDLAIRVGGVNYTRQVALALSKNPLPILIPCHRVITSDNKIGGYNLGVDIKKFLLEKEGSINKVKK